MAIQKINLGTEPLGEGGDTYRSANTKINENFSNPEHAASRMVGPQAGNVLVVGEAGLAWETKNLGDIAASSQAENPKINSGFYAANDLIGAFVSLKTPHGTLLIGGSPFYAAPPTYAYYNTPRSSHEVLTKENVHTFWTTQNATKDSKTNLLLESGNTVPQNSAASRLVGEGAGNLMEVGAFGLGKTNYSPYINFDTDFSNLGNGFYGLEGGAHSGLLVRQAGSYGNKRLCILGLPADPNQKNPFFYLINTDNGTTLTSQAANKYTFYTTANVTKDGNGFLKGASPVVDLYDDKIELNRDAEQQGNITFEKVSTGNYLVKGSLGFAQEGWYIEMPKDANGNVLVAVVYEQLENNDISIKTYDYMLNKKGRIVPDTETPLDIPEGRCINLRLHEIKDELDEHTSEPEVK